MTGVFERRQRNMKQAIIWECPGQPSEKCNIAESTC